MPCSHGHFEELGVGGRATNRSDGGFVRNRIAFTHEEQHGAGDVRERHGATVDDEAAREHPVVDDELVDELLESRAGPGDEALSTQKPSSRFALFEGLPIVQLANEVHELADFLVNRKQLEAGARENARQPFELVERRVEGALRKLEQAACDAVLDHREVSMNVDRASKRDQRSDALGVAIGGGLIREHPALRVSDDVHVVARCRAHPVDRIAHRLDVVVEGAFHAALFLLWGAEVDDPNVEP